MSKPLHTVAETPQYMRDAAKLSEGERERIVATIAAEPTRGEVVEGSGGVRKVRVGGRGKGKSGGYRLITGYVGKHAPVYLLALLSKGERANFSRAEVADMKQLMKDLDRFWRTRR